MARIRSIHPGQWTDENFVTCSPTGRLLSLAIRNEADDNGIFEWKPLTIKMRLMPADNVDVASLLSELEGASQVFRFASIGKPYGIIRNFTKFQRPKKPTFSYPVPNELPVGCELHPSYKAGASGRVENQLPTPPETDAQRKGREEKEEEKGSGRGSEKSSYVFAGKIIRLEREDFDSWRETFSAIPDLRAELSSIDTWLANKGESKNWFVSTASMLNKKHQDLLKAMPQKKPRTANVC